MSWKTISATTGTVVLMNHFDPHRRFNIHPMIPNTVEAAVGGLGLYFAKGPVIRGVSAGLLMDAILDTVQRYVPSFQRGG